MGKGATISNRLTRRNTLLGLGITATSLALMTSAELVTSSLIAGAAANAPLALSDLTIRDTHGLHSMAAELPDGPVILHFWATWCPPCRKELPEIARFHKKLEQQGLANRLMLVSADSKPYAEVTAFVDKLTADEGGLPTYQAKDRSTTAPFQIFGLPTTVFLDGERRIVQKIPGALPWNDESHGTKLISFLKGQPL